MLPFPLIAAAALLSAAQPADLILHSGHVLTVDRGFSTAEAVAVRGSHIVKVGSTREVLASERGPRTRVIDLAGRTVVPGLIDAHIHALSGGMSEFHGRLPKFDSHAAIQKYIREKARVTPKGKWIVVPRTFPTRLAEMAMPTRAVLDAGSTDHPVMFDASYVWVLNSRGLAECGITRETPDPAGGEIVRDESGEPTGILRNAPQLVRGIETAEHFTPAEKLAALEHMLKLYRAAGLTAVGDRAVTPEDIRLYLKLNQTGRLPVRAVLTWRIDSTRPVAVVLDEIRTAPWVTNQGDAWLKFGAFKVTLDGGMTIGTAYQRDNYGTFGRQLYGLGRPSRGQLFLDAEKLRTILGAAYKKGWSVTAHSQGGGAIDAMLDCFEALDKIKPIGATRSHLMHASFQSSEALARAKRLGIGADVQPAWLYLDAPALSKVFGEDGMRWFFPLRSYLDAGIPVAGGSDHMIGYGSNSAVNPFNPFLGMWNAITRKMVNGEVLEPGQRITREEALRLYTTGPAWIQFAENERGSIEAGKLADLVVIDRDYLTVPEDEIRRIRPVMVIINGKVVVGDS
jgi:predicted amidohydrolase YtcJ